MRARDRLARFLPASLLFHEEVAEGFDRLAAETFLPPKNKNEAGAHKEMVDLGFAPLKKGWPDFFVLASEEDMFVVEVKGPGDVVRPQQRVVLETLARKGIDVYIRWDGLDGVRYETVGESRLWKSRMAEVLAR